MSKDTGEKKGSGRTLPVVALTVGALLVGLIVWLQMGAKKAERDLKMAIRDFEEMKKWRGQIVEILSKNPASANLEATSDRPDEILQFITAKAQSSGIPREMITPQAERPDRSGSWEELRFTVRVQATKEAPLSLQSFVSFLRNVEMERPILKSKVLRIQFEGAGIVSANVTFSFFKPVS